MSSSKNTHASWPESNDDSPSDDSAQQKLKPTEEPPMRFEEAIHKLEQIIEQIESGQAGLEKSLSDYEHGMKLISRCRAILATTEKRIAELTQDAQGQLHVVEPPTAEADKE